MPGASVRNSACGKGHEEGGFLICKGGIEPQETPCSRAVQFSSAAQSCPTFCNPMNSSMPGLPVHHHLPEFTQTHVHRVSDAIQPSHPQASPSPLAPNPPSIRIFSNKSTLRMRWPSTGVSALAKKSQG